MRITEDGDYAQIDIFKSRDHSLPHCHVSRNEKEAIVFIFTDGITSRTPLGSRVIELIFSYYPTMLQVFTDINWPTGSCPDEYKKKYNFYSK